MAALLTTDVLIVSILLLLLFNEIKCDQVLSCTDNPETYEGKIVSNVVCKNRSLVRLRPVMDSNTITNVTVKFIPLFFDIIETDRVIQVNGMTEVSWISEFFRWNSSDYGMVNKVVVDVYYIWRPIYTRGERYHAGVDQRSLQDYDHNLLIHSNGSVIMRSVSNFYGPCQHDSEAWPFGEWTCQIRLLRIRDDVIDHVKLTAFDPLVNVDVSNLRENNVWIIVTNPSFTVSQFSNSTIELSITVKRHVLKYGYIIVLPGIVLLLISLASFWLTDQIYYRIMLNTMTALVQFTFLLFIFWLLRKSGAKNNATLHFLEDSVFVSFMGILFAVVNAKLMRKNTDPPKYLTKTIDSLRVVPYAGQMFYTSDEVRGHPVMEDDETALAIDVSIKDNPEWKMVRNAVDKCAFILFVLYFLFFRWL